MAALTNYNYSTDYAEFAVKDASELPMLPTTSKVGSGDLVGKVAAIKAGIAYTTDGNFDVYTLNDSTDEWNKIGG